MTSSSRDWWRFQPASSDFVEKFKEQQAQAEARKLQEQAAAILARGVRSREDADIVVNARIATMTPEQRAREQGQKPALPAVSPVTAAKNVGQAVVRTIAEQSPGLEAQLPSYLTGLPESERQALQKYLRSDVYREESLKELASPLNTLAFAFPPSGIVSGGLAGLGRDIQGVRTAGARATQVAGAKVLTRVPQAGVQEAGLRLAGARGVAGGAEKATQDAIAKVGGVDAWGRLSAEERQVLVQEAFERAQQPLPAAEAGAQAAKEPWQMKAYEYRLKSSPPRSITGGNRAPWEITTLDGHIIQGKTSEQFGGIYDHGQIEAQHKVVVKQALSEGKPVPPEVLADYPDLAKAAPTPSVAPVAETLPLPVRRERPIRKPRAKAAPETPSEAVSGAPAAPAISPAVEGAVVSPPMASAAAAAPPGGAGAGVPPRIETKSVSNLASTGGGEMLPPRDSWRDFARGGDSSGGKPPTSRGGVPHKGPDPDDVFEQVRKQASKGETIPETLLRRHEAAITTAENEARIAVDEASTRVRAMGLGQVRQGRWVPREAEIPVMDDLFEALHNPSKVASGEVRVPAGFEGEYARLRGLTDWEESMRIDFDPAMATVDDYFYRGWIVPKEGVAKPVAGVPRGRLGATPAFKKPRVDATYREMRDAGFEPLSWNPYEQWRISRLQGVRYRQQTQLIDHLKALDLAKTDASGVAVEGWRTPKVGPAFEGKIFATTDAMGEPVAMYSRRWAVPDELAGRLESIYGIPPSLGNVHVGNRTIDLMKAIDAVVFIPKRAKLFGSFFQQVDFLTRSYIGSWTGMVDGLMAGQPIEAVRRLAVWPQSAAKIIEANIHPGARLAIRRQLNSTTPIVKGRPGIHLRGIMEGGLSTIDTTLLPNNLDKVARSVAEEAGLLGNQAVRRALGSIESSMRRGLFEGTYPAAQITDIKNNIAPILVRRYGSLSDEALNGMIAKVVNKKYSTIPASQSVLQNRPLRELLRRLFFSIGESEGLLRQGAGAIRGPEAGFWREHWVGAYLGLIALANVIHFVSTGEPLPRERWSPLSRSKWGPLPIGYNRDFAAPNIPITDVEGRQITLDLVGQLDTAFRVLDLPSFLSSRESVPVRTLVTQITERDYFGRPIDRVGPGGVYSRTANLINDMFTPIGPGQAAIQIAMAKGRVPPGLIPSSEVKLGTGGQLVQATGLNVRAQAGTRWDKDFEVYNAIPTDALKLERGQLTRADYRQKHPDVDAKLFITGKVTSLQTTFAVQEALLLIQKNDIDPDAIQAIVARKKLQEEYAKLGRSLAINEVDVLIRLLGQAPAPTQQPQPSTTPTPAPFPSSWDKFKAQPTPVGARFGPQPTPVGAGR